MAATISAVSVEYVYVPVTANVDLDEQPVTFAFVPGNAAPTGATSWAVGVWVGEVAPVRTARVLIGPGTAVELQPGEFSVWVRVDDDPEEPVRKAGTLTVL